MTLDRESGVCRFGNTTPVSDVALAPVDVGPDSTVEHTATVGTAFHCRARAGGVTDVWSGTRSLVAGLDFSPMTAPGCSVTHVGSGANRRFAESKTVCGRNEREGPRGRVRGKVVYLPRVVGQQWGQVPVRTERLATSKTW